MNTDAQEGMKLELILKKYLSLFPQVSVTSTPMQQQEFSRRIVLKQQLEKCSSKIVAIFFV